MSHKILDVMFELDPCWGDVRATSPTILGIFVSNYAELNANPLEVAKRFAAWAGVDLNEFGGFSVFKGEDGVSTLAVHRKNRSTIVEINFTTTGWEAATESEKS